MSNITNAETLRNVTAGTDGLKQTANELQALSNSMRNVSNDIGAALNCRYTGMLQDSVSRICRNMETHASNIQTNSDDVRNVAGRCVQ